MRAFSKSPSTHSLYPTSPERKMEDIEEVKILGNIIAEVEK
jgi:hypothetical protein